MKKKKKILIIYNYILHYRKPFFNELAKSYDVTVLHSGKKSVEEIDAYKEIITPVRSVGPFFVQGGVLNEVSNPKYDVVISLFDVRWVAILLFLLFKNKKKYYVLWGAWITSNSIANKLRCYFLKKADANVFYTYEAKLGFSNLNIPPNKMFVANNTFDVGDRIKSFEYPIKNRVLFVGSLDSRKENNVLLKAFSNIIYKISPDIILTFIGSGSEKNILLELVLELGIENRVQFLGRINDTNILKNYYKEAIVSVSFGQAGLSVLQSMGYGVPFLTKINAISGGEKSNIKTGYNSVFCNDSQKSLEDSLIKLCNNIESSRELGKCAYNYYEKFCTIQNMTQGFIDAIEGQNLAKVDRN